MSLVTLPTSKYQDDLRPELIHDQRLVSSMPRRSTLHYVSLALQVRSRKRRHCYCDSEHHSVAIAKPKQGIDKHHTPTRYRNAARRRPSHGHRGSMRKNFMKIGGAVPEICSRTDRHTQKQTHRQTDKLLVIHRSPAGAE